MSNYKQCALEHKHLNRAVGLFQMEKVYVMATTEFETYKS